jgi:hypothetical protein
MSIIDKKVCNDLGDNIACLGTIDERYTMLFDDIGQPPIYWCSHCGPEAHEQYKLLMDVCERGGPEVVKAIMEEVDREVAKVEAKKVVS